MNHRMSFCLFLVTILTMHVCAQQAAPPVDPLSDMKRTDIAMSALAEKAGFWKALLAYADEGFVKLNDGSYPLVGKKAFAEKIGENPGTTSLTWSPVGGEVARSGELGFTWGNWKLVGKDTTLYGNYFSVWKRAPDGSWKLLLDGGNSIPPPQK